MFKQPVGAAATVVVGTKRRRVEGGGGVKEEEEEEEGVRWWSSQGNWKTGVCEGGSWWGGEQGGVRGEQRKRGQAGWRGTRLRRQIYII